MIAGNSYVDDAAGRDGWGQKDGGKLNLGCGGQLDLSLRWGFSAKEAGK